MVHLCTYNIQLYHIIYISTTHFATQSIVCNEIPRCKTKSPLYILTAQYAINGTICNLTAQYAINCTICD